MGKYKIEIEEILQKVYDVEAESIDEAISVAEDKYYDGEYKLTPETIKRTNFRPYDGNYNEKQEIKIREELYYKLKTRRIVL